MRHSVRGSRLLFMAASIAVLGSLAAPARAQNLPNPALHPAYGRLPLYFEENVGQSPKEVRFIARGAGYAFFITGTETVAVLRKHEQSPAVVRMSLARANRHPVIQGRELMTGRSNYLLGRDPSKWRTNVPHYGRVTLAEVYPGIDAVYYGNQRQIEYDFVVRPGADPRQIRMHFEGTERIEVDGAGDLVLHVPGGTLRQRLPYVYQEVAGTRHPVRAAYVKLSSREFGVAVERYDAARPLVIDPVLIYSTYLAGSGGADGLAIAADASGNAYVTGTAYTDFPEVGPPQGTMGGFADAFVAKLNASGSALIYATYLGGNDFEQGKAIAVDSSGNAYVAGYTQSADFPTTPGALDATFGGVADGFVAKLNASGTAFVYSTYLGGNDFDMAQGVAADSSGNAYVAGFTQSADFSMTAGALDGTFDGLADAFVAKLDTGGASVYSTYLGGSGNEGGRGIAVDGAGNAYVTGQTTSTDFPLEGELQATLAGDGDPLDQDAFVAKLAADGASLVYSTYLGGTSDFEVGTGIAVDGSGNAYVTGETSSTDFPLASPMQAAGGGSPDAFVARLAADGASLIYSTYLGGSSEDYGRGIALDSTGNAYVVGQTYSTDFPAAGAPQPAGGGPGNSDAFVAKVAADGASLIYATYLGGSSEDFGNGIALDSFANAYVTGYTTSADFPTEAAYQSELTPAGGSAFVARIGPLPPAIAGDGIAPASGPVGGGQTVVITGTLLASATSVTFGGNSAAVVDNTATSITVTTPAHAAGAVDVVVTTADGIATATNGYTYVAAPTLTSADPACGPTIGGQSVTVTGTNLDGATLVFGGDALAAITTATTATITTPAHAAGAVDITLTTAGGSATATNGYVYVEQPTITPDGPTNLCTGGSVTLTSSSESSYQWYDGATLLAGATNQSYLATTSGNYTVIAGSCVTAPSAVTTVTIYPIPGTPTVNPLGPTTFCAPGSVQLVSSISEGNQWYNGEGLMEGETSSGYLAYNAGNYYTIVTVNGCSGAPSATTTVSHVTPPQPTITPGGPTTFCTGGSVTLTASTASGNQWLLEGYAIGGETNQTYVATASGNYTVVSNESGCDSAPSPTIVVTVNPIPATPAIIPGGPTTFCAGGSVTLTSSDASGNQWHLDGNPIGGATNQTYDATATGGYTVVVTASGCASAHSPSTTVTVTPLPATATITPGGPTTFCTGGSVTLTSSGASGHQWHLNGTPIEGATNPTYVATASGNYTVVVTASGCASAPSLTTVVTINPIPATPTITPGGPTTFCSGGSVTLTSSSAGGNQWHLNGNPIGGATDQAYIATASGSYTVVVTASGCANAPSLPTVVTVNPIPATPTITPGGPTTFCTGGERHPHLEQRRRQSVVAQWKSDRRRDQSGIRGDGGR